MSLHTPHNFYTSRKLIRGHRFIDAENWRKQIDLDNLVRNWDYPEKAEIFKYYPQYYHKTDKVRSIPHIETRLGSLMKA